MNFTQWIVELPDGRRTTVWAHTKSEARARAKKLLAIPGKERLPVGTNLRPLKKTLDAQNSAT